MPYDLQPEVHNTSAQDEAARVATAEAEAKKKESDEADVKAKALQAEQDTRVEVAETARKEAEDRQNQLLQAYVTAVNAGGQPSQEEAEAAAKAKATAPNAEDDPGAYIDAKIDAGIKKGLADQVAPLTEQYKRDRLLGLQTAVDQRRAAMRLDTAQFPNFAEVETEMDEYSKNFPLEDLSRAGALEEVYIRVMGRKNIAALASSNVRDQAPESFGRVGGQREPGDTTGEPTKLNEEESLFARKDGLNAKQFKIMQGTKSFDIDDFRRMKEGA